MTNLQRAIFLDRDGVINVNRADHVKAWAEFEFIDGALVALARLAATEFQIVIVSNQSAIGRGLATRATVDEIHRRMRAEIERAGGRVTLILYCPHASEDGCECRKPRPGLLLQASEALALDLSRSYLIGDSLDDVGAGRAVGCTTILVTTGRGREARARLDAEDGAKPIITENLASAVEWIMERESTKTRKHESAKE